MEEGKERGAGRAHVGKEGVIGKGKGHRERKLPGGKVGAKE